MHAQSKGKEVFLGFGVSCSKAKRKPGSKGHVPGYALGHARKAPNGLCAIVHAFRQGHAASIARTLSLGQLCNF